MTTARDVLLDRVVAWFAAHGVGDTSLRTVADGVGSSHRMLNYHFGSRDGLLEAVVSRTWRSRLRGLSDAVVSSADPYPAAYAYWESMADEASLFGPLFFEVSAAAMQGKPWAVPLGAWIEEWKNVLTTLFVRAGHGRESAAVLAQMSLALARGLLFELALTGDGNRAAADTAIHTFLESTRTSEFEVVQPPSAPSPQPAEREQP